MMRLHAPVARTVRLGLLLAVTSLLTGCAEWPAGSGTVTRRLLDMQMTMRGSIDPNAYYLFVIDNNAVGTDGPQILAPATSFLGNGRATGSYTHYVEYHQGQFELFRDQPEQPGVTPPARTALGEPFAFDDTSSAGTLSCTLDVNQLKLNASDARPAQLEVNFITVNEIVLPGDVPAIPRQSDGLGLDGNTFLVLRLQNGLTVLNDGIEGVGEVFGSRQLDPAYDIADFRVAVRDGS